MNDVNSVKPRPSGEGGIMADDFLDTETKMVLAARWGDRGKPDVTYKYDKGDRN